MSVDPLASKYPSYSPYNYVLNNPMKFIDPNGKEVFGLQVGVELGMGLGGSANITLTYDTRGGSWNLLGTVGYGVVAGISGNLNVGFLEGEKFTRTSDLIGNAEESSVDLAFAVKGGGYTWSECEDENGKATGRGAHVFSWSPGLAAKASHLKTTTWDIPATVSSVFSSSENQEGQNDSNQNNSNKGSGSTSSSNSVQYSLLGIDPSKSPQAVWDSMHHTATQDNTNTGN